MVKYRPNEKEKLFSIGKYLVVSLVVGCGATEILFELAEGKALGLLQGNSIGGLGNGFILQS
ncbi:hypothetical protein [Neisseria sp. S1]|uniref:hypothetical protein n=1 Tax=Neisseria sp. S1 TaxID=3318354 RepID=UPI003A8C3599